MKRALITGITGQDGSYLAELLIDKDAEVHGIVRRSWFLHSRNRLRIARWPQPIFGVEALDRVVVET